MAGFETIFYSTLVVDHARSYGGAAFLAFTVVTSVFLTVALFAIGMQPL